MKSENPAYCLCDNVASVLERKENLPIKEIKSMERESTKGYNKRVKWRGEIKRNMTVKSLQWSLDAKKDKNIEK